MVMVTMRLGTPGVCSMQAACNTGKTGNRHHLIDWEKAGIGESFFTNNALRFLQRKGLEVKQL